jgi:hypothetical protein
MISITDDTYSYQGWLVSDKFWKRSFACFGYTQLAGLLIILPVYLAIFVVLFVTGGMF